jgi:hypothetical protein
MPFKVYHRDILECLNINAAKFKAILENRGIDTFKLSTKGDGKYFSIQVADL